VTIKVLRTHTIEAKAMSVNISTKTRHIPQRGKWGRLFQTYLPDDFLPHDIENYSLRFDFTIRDDMDLDNCLKCVVDELQKKYGFNDNKIRHFVAYKQEVENNTVADIGVDERYLIKISLTERILYDDSDQQNTNRSKELPHYTERYVRTTDEDYQNFCKWATNSKKSKS